MWPFSSSADRELERRLRQAAPINLAPGARQRLLTAVLEEYRRLPAPDAPASPRPFALQIRPLIVSVLLLVILGGGAGTAIAADAAKPGDFLFGVDRAVENIRVALTTQDTAKAKLKVELAQERERELRQLQAQQQPADATRAKELATAALDDAEAAWTTALAGAESAGNDAEKQSVQETGEALASLRRVLDLATDVALPGDAGGEPIAADAINVRIAGAESRVTAEISAVKSDFTLPIVDRSELIAEIARRLTLSEAQVAALIHVEVAGDGGDADTGAANQNGNTNSDPSGSDNANGGGVNAAPEPDNTNEQPPATDGNGTPPASADLSAWHITVRRESSIIRVEVRHDGSAAQQWSTSTIDLMRVLDEIQSQTGLTAAEILSVWDVQ